MIVVYCNLLYMHVGLLLWLCVSNWVIINIQYSHDVVTSCTKLTLVIQVNCSVIFVDNTHSVQIRVLKS